MLEISNGYKMMMCIITEEPGKTQAKTTLA